MASTEQLPDWIATNARQRRLLIGALIAGLVLHGLVYFNQRAIFMPWNAAEHPLVATTPTAFFAQVSPPGRARGVAASRVATNRASAPVLGQASDIAFGAPEGAPAGADIGGLASDAVPFDLPEATLFTVAGADDGGFGPGAPGATSSAAGAPTSFVGPTSVPEMSTWAMLLLGFGVIGVVIRRRRWSIAMPA